MFDHIVFGVSDYESSKVFFLKALEPIGIAVVSEGPLGIEPSEDGKPSLCIRRIEEKKPAPSIKASPSALEGMHMLADKKLQAYVA